MSKCPPATSKTHRDKAAGGRGGGLKPVLKDPPAPPPLVVFTAGFGSAGTEHSFVIKPDGSLWGTGKNSQGQLGHGKIGTTGTSYVQLISDKVKDVSARHWTTVVLKTDGR